MITKWHEFEIDLIRLDRRLHELRLAACGVGRGWGVTLLAYGRVATLSLLRAHIPIYPSVLTLDHTALSDIM